MFHCRMQLNAMMFHLCMDLSKINLYRDLELETLCPSRLLNPKP